MIFMPVTCCCLLANYFSAMTVYDWILAEKSSRTFYSPRRFGTMRRHLCVKSCFGEVEQNILLSSVV